MQRKNAETVQLETMFGGSWEERQPNKLWQGLFNAEDGRALQTYLEGTKRLHTARTQPNGNITIRLSHTMSRMSRIGREYQEARGLTYLPDASGEVKDPVSFVEKLQQQRDASDTTKGIANDTAYEARVTDIQNFTAQDWQAMAQFITRLASPDVKRQGIATWTYNREENALCTQIHMRNYAATLVELIHAGFGEQAFTSEKDGHKMTLSLDPKLLVTHPDYLAFRAEYDARNNGINR